MSKSSKQEVQVIDDNLLIEGILSDKLDSDAEPESVNIVDLASRTESLILSFKSIGKIENLVGFDNLLKLCLDNNAIEEICNLEHLRKLRWLDLSFNKIRKIQGLSTLQYLEDLTLFSNKLTVVEDLENCVRLQCLSLGNNKIDSLEQAIRLRQLPALRMLTLAGNPICVETEYRMTVLAYISKLKYLDNAFVDATEVAAAKESFHDELLDLEEKESVITEKVPRDNELLTLLLSFKAQYLILLSNQFSYLRFHGIRPLRST